VILGLLQHLQPLQHYHSLFFILTISAHSHSISGHSHDLCYHFHGVYTGTFIGTRKLYAVQSFYGICTLSRFPKRTKASVSMHSHNLYSNSHCLSSDNFMASSTHSRSLYTRILRSLAIITHGLYNNLNTSSGNVTASTCKQSGKQFRCRSRTTIAIFFFSNSAR
jgi:hypothetical protein